MTQANFLHQGDNNRAMYQGKQVWYNCWFTHGDNCLM